MIKNLILMNLLKIISGFILLFSFGYYINKIISIKKDNKNIIETNTTIEYKTVVNYIKDLPSFIKKDLSKFRISSTSFDQKSWKEFLNLYIKKEIKNDDDNIDVKMNNLLLNELYDGKIFDLNSFKSLIEQGYDINKPDKYGTTPISYYVQNMKSFDINIIQSILNLGVKLENKSISSNLTAAALINKNQEVGHEMIKYLEEEDILLYDKDSVLTNLIFLGLSKYKDEYISKILPHVEINSKVIFRSLAQYIIEINASNTTIEKLLDRNLKINQNSDSLNVLHSSAQNDNISIENYKKFIELGAKVNAQEKNYLNTPLMYAVKRGRVEQVKVLLKNKAKISIINKQGKDVFDFLNDYIKDETKKKDILNLLNEYEKK